MPHHQIAGHYHNICMATKHEIVAEFFTGK